MSSALPFLYTKNLNLTGSYSKIAMLKHDPSQTRITDHYDIVSQVDILTKLAKECI